MSNRAPRVNYRQTAGTVEYATVLPGEVGCALEMEARAARSRPSYYGEPRDVTSAWARRLLSAVGDDDPSACQAALGKLLEVGAVAL